MKHLAFSRIVLIPACAHVYAPAAHAEHEHTLASFYASLGDPVFSKAGRLPEQDGQGNGSYQVFSMNGKAVRLGHGELRVQGKAMALAKLPRLDNFGFVTLRTLDMPAGEAYLQKDAQLLCVEWPLGHSGSASRWRGVAVVPLSNRQGLGTALSFAGPYAGCGAVVRPQGVTTPGALAWGVFDIRFESAHEANGGFFALRALTREAPMLKSFQIRYLDPTDLQTFNAKPF